MLNAQELSDLRALLEKLPDETWMAPKKSSIVGSGIVASPFGRVVAVTIPSSEDAALIVAARNALPALLDENAALRAEVERLKAEVQHERIFKEEGFKVDEELLDDREATITALRARCDALAGAWEQYFQVQADLRDLERESDTTSRFDDALWIKEGVENDARAALALHRGEQGPDESTGSQSVPFYDAVNALAIDAADARYSDELIGNRFRAALHRGDPS